jgi:hypothetical protein
MSLPCARQDCGHDRDGHVQGLGCRVQGCDCKRYIDPDTSPYALPKPRSAPLFMPKGLTLDEYKALVKPNPREPYKGDK